MAPGLNTPALIILAAPFLVCLPLILLGLDQTSSLAYSRSAIADEAQYWRLLTAHLAHTNLAHALLNLAAWPLILLLAGNGLSIKQWIASFLFCALGVSIGLWWFSPTVQWYVGLSGVLHGLLVLAAITAWPRWRLLTLTILPGVLAKLYWEQSSGALSGSAAWISHPIIVDAHLYGALSGLLFAVAGITVTRLISQHG